MFLALGGCVSAGSDLNLGIAETPSAQSGAQLGPQTVEIAAAADSIANTGQSVNGIGVPRPSPVKGTAQIASQINAATPALAIADPNVQQNPTAKVIQNTLNQQPAPTPKETVQVASLDQNASAQAVSPVRTDTATTTTATSNVQTGAAATTTTADVNKAAVPETANQKPAASSETSTAAVADKVALPATQLEPAVQEQPKATGLFARLFQSQKPRSAPRPRKNIASNSGRGEEGTVTTTRSATSVAERRRKRQQLALQKAADKKRATVERTASTDALPGVKSNSQLFGINNSKTAKKRANTRVASIAGLGSLSPNGLRVQHSKVQVACLKPGVVRILKLVERHYGRKPIITSGYRSPNRNRRAGGAKNSQHIYCKAVDIQVEGVSKWKLAKLLRTLPGRGGVGTYCRTKSVHIDIGTKRDWHHPCRRSSKRKKRKA